jgi:hypothetical protein
MALFANKWARTSTVCRARTVLAGTGQSSHAP